MTLLNSFNANGLFLYPLKTLKNPKRSLMFSEGIERGQWHEIG